MASRKDYTYQIKGNKLSLLERDQTSGTGLNYVYAGVDGDGVMDGTTSGSISLTSPVTAVTDGIEIEYTYSPQYENLTEVVNTNKYFINGWTVIDGYLTLLRGAMQWSSISSISVNENIVIKNSNRWNGVHKIQEIEDPHDGTHGGIKTYTKVNIAIREYIDTSCAQLIDETVTGFSSEPNENITYLWMVGGVTASGPLAHNNGLFSGWSWNTASGGTIDFGTNGTYYSSNNDGELEINNTTAVDGQLLSFSANSTQTIQIYEAFLDSNAYIISDPNILNDESDTIDISSYLAKALVYYVKGKLAEDQMNIEAKEYMMREFRRMLEKHESSKVAGPRGIMTGSHSIR